MNSWLLDTNVVSELRRPKPSKVVLDFLETQPASTLHLSTVTIAEIRYGIERQTSLERRAEIQTWLDHEVRPMFAGRILEITEDVMLLWRLTIEKGRQANYTFAQPDLIIAATAMHHGMTIVSRNTKDFDRAAVPVLNPWQ